jgi:hypothetical protein
MEGMSPAKYRLLTFTGPTISKKIIFHKITSTDHFIGLSVSTNNAPLTMTGAAERAVLLDLFSFHGKVCCSL